MRAWSNIGFQIISRLPVIGDVPIMANAVLRATPHIANQRWRHASAELVSGLCQAALDDIVPVVGRDLGQEVSRLIFGAEYLPPSLLLGWAFKDIHAKRDDYMASYQENGVRGLWTLPPR